MKKKYTVPTRDKKDWISFTSKIGNISDKDNEIFYNNEKEHKERKLDLHGFSLDNANRVVKNFIIESFNKNYKKLLIITGKGSRSKSYDNPYISDNLSILKNSIPDYIKNDENLNSIISKITLAERKDGGDGAINIFLKNKKKLQNKL